MPNTQMGEVAFTYRDEDFLLVFDFEAIEYFEKHCGSILSFAQEMARASANGGQTRISPLVRLVLAGLLRHHPEVSGDEAMKMIADPAVMKAVGTGFTAAMPDGDGDDDRETGDKGAAARPPKGRSKPKKGSTGRR